MSNVTIRKGPTISASKQAWRNKENRGKKLEQHLYTPGGKNLRVEDRFLQPEELNALMRDVDERTRTNEILDFVSPKLTLPQTNIVTIKRGYYQGIGGTHCNPLHSIPVLEDFGLFVLTIGFLRRYDNMMLVDKILNNRYNSQKEATQAVGGLTLKEARQIESLINASLPTNTEIKLPTIAEVEMFASLPNLSEARAGGFMWFTSEPHKSGGFTYVYRMADSRGGKKDVGRHWLEKNSAMNTSVVYRVLDSQ